MPVNTKVPVEEFVAVLDRAENGPMLDIDEWDRVYIYEKIQDLVQKHDIRFDLEDPGVPSDDPLADRLFEAGMALAVDSGVYCTDTKRRMVWTRDELDAILAAVPEVVHVGEGDDRVAIRKRLPDEDASVVIGGGPWGVVVPEKLFLPLTTAYVQEPSFDFFCTAALPSTYGHPIRAHSPWDTLACWQEIRMTFEALDTVSRPGMAICGPNTSASAIGTVSTMSHGGVRPVDWNNAAFMSELKVSYEDLIRACHCIQTGSFLHNFYNPIYGGFAGGAEGTSIATVAGFVLMRATLFGDAYNTGVSHAHKSYNTFPALIPAQAVAMQALARNTNLTVANFTRPAAGPGEIDMLYEVAAYQLATVPSGVEVAKGVQTATGRHEAHCSPLEVRFLAQVAHAAEKLSRAEADLIVKQLIAKYKDGQGEGKIGMRFDEVYDLETLEPTKEWQAVFDQACEELESLGVPLH
jgi:methylamine--corrinoid protein Co-methyltransferase